MKEIEITNENFNQYFFDARKTKPESGQVLAKFAAVADFIEGQAKRDIIYLLKINKAKEAVQVMNRIHGCKEPWCYDILINMANDLLQMTEVEVEQKPYEMVVEFLFWTQKEYVPNDPHWETINVIGFDPETGEYKSRIEI
jgi:hypothetical protein